MSGKKRSRHVILISMTVLVLIAAILAGCGTSTSKTTANTGGSLPLGPIDQQTLVNQAKREGLVVGYGMPANWANLGGMWNAFNQKYGVKTAYEAQGNMSSAQELQAFQAEKAHPVGDVGDIGISFGGLGEQMGVLAPYENKYWNQIPADLKDPNGYWTAAYYGVISFVVNTDKVKNIPHTWADLLNPQYKGLIGFDDPRSAAEAFDGLVAAAYANGGSLNNLEPGIAYFAKLHKIGNWTGVPGDPAQMQSGQAAIEIAWNYLGQSDAQNFKGNPHFTVVIPSDGTVAGPYVEVINKYAPHPYAARLLNTYLFSDAGQIAYAEGGAYPVRMQYITLPSSVHLPPLNMAKVHFLTGDLSGTQKSVSQEWSGKVLGQ